MQWIEEGSCRDRPRQLWFQEGNSKRAKINTERAIQICNSCPVVQECRTYAMRNEAYGTWGGLSELDREILRLQNGEEPLMPLKFRKQNPKLKELQNASH